MWQITIPASLPQFAILQVSVVVLPIARDNMANVKTHMKTKIASATIMIRGLSLLQHMIMLEAKMLRYVNADCILVSDCSNGDLH